jgi:uncharacterized membrane protein YeaQ/YmgE (transglycosylase-associated protein family)
MALEKTRFKDKERQVTPVSQGFKGSSNPTNSALLKTDTHIGSAPKEKIFMGILGTLLIGLLVGAVAKLLMPGDDPGGFIITMLIGIAGAFAAKYIGQAMGFYSDGESAGFIASVIGAMLLLLLYRLIARRKAHH